MCKKTEQNEALIAALRDIGKVIDGDYGDMNYIQSFEQIRTILQGTAGERDCDILREESPFCVHCTEPHCHVNPDGTCALINIYLETKKKFDNG